MRLVSKCDLPQHETLYTYGWGLAQYRNGKANVQQRCIEYHFSTSCKHFSDSSFDRCSRIQSEKIVLYWIEFYFFFSNGELIPLTMMLFVNFAVTATHAHTFPSSSLNDRWRTVEKIKVIVIRIVYHHYRRWVTKHHRVRGATVCHPIDFLQPRTKWPNGMSNIVRHWYTIWSITSNYCIWPRRRYRWCVLRRLNRPTTLYIDALNSSYAADICGSDHLEDVMWVKILGIALFRSLSFSQFSWWNTVPMSVFTWTCSRFNFSVRIEPAEYCSESISIA